MSAPKKPSALRIPIVLALLTVVGLASALLGDGPWEALPWLALSVPLAAAAMIALRSRGTNRPT